MLHLDMLFLYIYVIFSRRKSEREEGERKEREEKVIGFVFRALSVEIFRQRLRYCPRKEDVRHRCFRNYFARKYTVQGFYLWKNIVTDGTRLR